MFISHYITEPDIIEAFYNSDEIYYSAKFLFKSNKSIKDLYKNYCSLAKLIFLYYDRIRSNRVSNVELNAVVNSMMIGNIPEELIDFYSMHYA